MESQIRVMMFDDQIEIVSSGGLPSGITENAIRIVLPVFKMDLDLTDDERIIYRLLSKTMLKPISEIAPYVPFGKSKTTQLLKKMNKKGIVAVEGKGRGTKYVIK